MIIYTYEVSQVPPLTDKLKDKICSLESAISNLILECAGNPKALEYLLGILDDTYDTCELNLAQIQVIADKKEKQMDWSTVPDEFKRRYLFNNVCVAETFQILTKVVPNFTEVILPQIYAKARKVINSSSNAQIESILSTDEAFQQFEVNDTEKMAGYLIVAFVLLCDNLAQETGTNSEDIQKQWMQKSVEYVDKTSPEELANFLGSQLQAVDEKAAKSFRDDVNGIT